MQRRRKHIRLKNHDYSTGSYFITICVRNGECDLGEIKENKSKLSEIGLVAKACWEEIPQHFPNVSLDEFVVMPNHFHGIVTLRNGNLPGRSLGVGAGHVLPLPQGSDREDFPHCAEITSTRTNTFGPQPKGSLPVVVGQFKAAVSRHSRQNGHHYFAWQRGYYDSMIRNEKAMFAVRKYIVQNPLKWHLDELNPFNRSQHPQ